MFQLFVDFVIVSVVGTGYRRRQHFRTYCIFRYGMRAASEFQKALHRTRGLRRKRSLN